MRLALTAALLCAAATPALAQSQPEPSTRDKTEALARALNNPMVQEGAAAMLTNLAGIVLDTRVGPAARYIDPTIGEQDTLRDIQRRRDPNFEKNFHNDARSAVVIAGKLTEGALQMQDSLDQTAARLRAALAPLRGALTTK
ncbi:MULTISPECIES: hypothetical protein [unclassified Sphingomonas]|uniref:hypothetical protein n=1 Tax=unclassified Sphingomonas TaxID=196159 RepID=UPI0022B2C54E|nr:hypothetical protein [Sphingomonas sp. NIBR02145]WHU01717.1 hypothetical protein O3305_16160 [Sphingomonas sp. NIBR02145]